MNNQKLDPQHIQATFEKAAAKNKAPKGKDRAPTEVMFEDGLLG